MTISKSPIGVSSQTQWNEKWPQLFEHYQQDTRHAYYVNAFLSHAEGRVLEIGAGSFRDMALLNRLGVDCWGTDFSQTAVGLARKHFPELSEKIFQGNAFELEDIADAAFDLTFHNGLWVLFNSDEEVLKLATAQARVSRHTIIATVHNAHNHAFVEYFAKLAVSDPLYRIRFFAVEEMRGLLLKVCRKVDVFPVGKGKKHHEDEMINQGRATRARLRSFFDAVKMDNLETSERLLCIGHL
jgi:SAM-dependent methyltransferase